MAITDLARKKAPTTQGAQIRPASRASEATMVDEDFVEVIGAEVAIAAVEVQEGANVEVAVATGATSNKLSCSLTPSISW